MKTIEEMKSFPAARKNYRPEKVEKLSEEQMKWFRDAKFGMFIHWGVYSMLGKGEWVLMNEHLDVRKYETLKDDFLAENFDAEQWAKNAKAAGMKYMVLTTRHHDGFCLFDSKCSDFTAMKGAAHRDFVKEYVEEKLICSGSTVSGLHLEEWIGMEKEAGTGKMTGRPVNI